MNHYELLSIDPGASSEVIKKACRKMIHAINSLEDKNDQEKSSLVDAVHNIRACLTDKEQREIYDTSIGIETVPESWSSSSPRWLAGLPPLHPTRPRPAPISRPSRQPSVPSSEMTPFGEFGSAMVPFGGDMFGGSGLFGSGLLQSMSQTMSQSMSQSMSDSIIPRELQEHVSAAPAHGSFTFMEFSRRRVSDGWEESGVHRTGDLNHDNVTERRFARHKAT
jgi:hypothetical protein